jgi:hypothetical protein
MDNRLFLMFAASVGRDLGFPPLFKRFMMNERFKNLYERLLDETQAIWRQDIPEAEKAESSCSCCLRYLEQVKAVVEISPFRDEQEEIAFFKYEKPWFSGRMEYYTQVYLYVLFCPSENLEEFSAGELDKIRKFRESHANFIHYITSGATNRDREYFLNTHEKLTAMQDQILAQLTGYALYEEYIKKKQLENQ